MKNIIVIAFLFLSIDSYCQQVQGQKVNITNERDLQPESTIINVPLETSLSKYKNIVLSVEGWAANANEKDVRKALKQSIFIVEKKDYQKGVTKMEENTLYFFWYRSTEGDDRATTIVLRDFNMKVLYSASHTNVGSAKMLNFLLSQ